MSNATPNPYEQQAENFLQENGIGFNVKFVGYGKHFADDAEIRNIYELTLYRTDKGAGAGSFTVRFGQSLHATNREEAPTAYDLLASLTKSDPGSFDDFCADFGYDTDSRRAYATWEAVCEEWRKVEAFFSGEELEQLEDIQ